MKKILAAGAVVFGGLGVFGVLPNYLGMKAQESLEIQHRALADTFFFDMVSHKYERGWFTSTETTVVRVHPEILSNLGGYLPDNVKTVLEKPVVMVNHVKHYPFADGFTPVRAVVETEFQYDPEVQKTLSRFFGQQVPVSAHNVIKLDGSGRYTVKVAPFEYEELSGIKLDWKGMDAEVDYAANFTEYQSRFTLPGFKAVLADKGSLNAEQIEVAAKTYPGSNGLSLGSSETKLGRFEIEWKDSISYNVRLNELINMVTDLQIGAFINPNGDIPPSKVSLDKLSYRTETEEKNGYIDSRGVFAFDKLNYGENQYGPLNIDIAAEHLNAKALADMKKSLQRIAMDKYTGDQAREQVLAAARNEGAPLFTDNPLFRIKRFEFQTPQGHVNSRGQLSFDGLSKADLESFPDMVKKMRVDLDLDVSQKLIEEFVITQARSLFAVEDPNSEQEKQEVTDTIRLLVAGSIDTMIGEGHLKRSNGAVMTRLEIAGNRITLNGKQFEARSDDDDLWQGLEDTPASAPAAGK